MLIIFLPHRRSLDSGFAAESARAQQGRESSSNLTRTKLLASGLATSSGIAAQPAWACTSAEKAACELDLLFVGYTSIPWCQRRCRSISHC